MLGFQKRYYVLVYVPQGAAKLQGVKVLVFVFHLVNINIKPHNSHCLEPVVHGGGITFRAISPLHKVNCPKSQFLQSTVSMASPEKIFTVLSINISSFVIKNSSIVLRKIAAAVV